jgi:HPt (histidine-containing phosphotransfer) domain-containing protein
LYNKIVGLVKKFALAETTKEIKKIQNEKSTYIDLNYLNQRTKSNPALMLEMISAYLEQTPPLIITMKQSLQEQDWGLLYATVHKMIPSFSIMGMNTDIENTAKKIQEYARAQQQMEDLAELVLQIERVCTQACQELEMEFEKIKNNNL